MRILARAQEPGIASGIAYAVSLVVNPLIVPPVLTAVILTAYGATRREVGMTVLLVLLLFSVVPLFILYATARWKGATALELPAARHRFVPLISGVLIALAASALVGLTTDTAIRFLRIILVLYAVNVIALALITRDHKISLHVVAVAGALSIFIFMLLVSSTPMVDTLVRAAVLSGAVVVPLVMWARVRLGAHRPSEVMSAATFGLLAPLLELWFLGG